MSYSTYAQSDEYDGSPATGYQFRLIWYIDTDNTNTDAGTCVVTCRIYAANTRTDGSIIFEPTCWFSASVNGSVYKNASWTTSKTVSAGTSKYALGATITRSCNADGTFDSFTLRLAAKLGTSGTKTIEKTWTITPDSIDIRAQFSSVPTTQLGSSRTIKISKTAFGTQHYVTLTASCGNWSETIASLNNSSTSFTHTPPISLAQYNTTGTSVEVTYTLQTYYKSGSSYYKVENGATGSTAAITKTVTLEIPTSVKPSCTLAVADANGYATRFGGYIKRYSDVVATVTPTLAYNSAIQDTEISGDGVQTSAGSKTVKARVKDARGRWSSYATKTITVLDYTAPQLDFEVHRVNDDGTDDISGAHCKVDYTAAVKSYGVTNDNDKALTLYYKKSTEDTYQSVEFDMDSYSVTGSYTFDADDASSYDVVMTLADTFTTASRTAPLSTAFSLIHWNSSGKGIAFGKLSEIDAFEVGMAAHFYAGITYDVQALDDDVNLDDVTTSGVYLVNCSSATNAPETGIGFLEVFSGTTGTYYLCLQRFNRVASATTGAANSTLAPYQRAYSGSKGTWTDWEYLTDL